MRQPLIRDADRTPSATSHPGGGRAATAEQVAVHSLTWLVVANAVGLLLATLLLVPELGRALSPLSYGRWLPVHLDLQFYGWCTVPLLGLLYRLYLPESSSGRFARWALGAWSGALLASAVAWLTGHSSGKTFLEWSGPARFVLAFGLTALAASIVAAWLESVGRARQQDAIAPRERLRLAWTGLLALAMVPVPIALWLATNPAVVPPINPDSGGATHGNTLGSVLGVAAVMALSPLILGLRARDGGRFGRWVFLALGLHGLAFVAMGHGDASHHELVQELALLSLVPWLPLLLVHLARFPWRANQRPWLMALGAWGLVLWITGLLAGLPGFNESWKFTNALVGHVHAALAGFATCWLVLVLDSLTEGTRLTGLFAGRTPYRLWQLGLGIHVASLLVLGTFEGRDPLLLAGAGALSTFAYAARWLGGALMLVASGRWLAAALEALAPATTETFDVQDAPPLLPRRRRV